MARGGGAGRGGGGRGYGGGTNNFIQALDEFDEQMLRNYEDYSYSIQATWENFAGNDGQMTIVHNHILPYSHEHIARAKEEWPWSGDADEYLDGVLNCYDADVMERAFSGVIFDLYDHISGLWMHTEEIQKQHDDLRGSPAAHSTNPPWM